VITDKKNDAWISVIDESINADVVRSMNLFMQCSPQAFSAALLDTDRNKFVSILDYRFPYPLGINDLTEKILEIIDQQKPLLDNGYDSVVLSFCGYNNTLIPDAFFDPAKLDLFYYANHASLQDDVVEEKLLFDNLRRISARNVYAVPKKLYDFFSSYYTNISIFHGATPFIEGLLSLHKNTAEKVVTVNVQSGYFEMVVNQGGDLIFYNRFRYQTVEDFLYYVVFVYEQLGLNPETQVLYMAGAAEKNSALVNLAVKYIRYIQFVQRPSFAYYSYGFDEVAPHYHFSLYNQFLCV
jgi:hypothetical protein